MTSSRRKSSFRTKRVEAIISFLERHTWNLQPADVPDDLMVLGTAKAAGASFLVTGDRDLLTLDSYDDTDRDAKAVLGGSVTSFDMSTDGPREDFK